MNENLFDKSIFSKKDDTKITKEKDILDALADNDDGLEHIDNILKEEERWK